MTIKPQANSQKETFGILLLLLLTGMEMDWALVKKMRRAPCFFSLAGILFPFTCGFLLGQCASTLWE